MNDNEPFLPEEIIDEVDMVVSPSMIQSITEIMQSHLEKQELAAHLDHLVRIACAIIGTAEVSARMLSGQPIARQNLVDTAVVILNDLESKVKDKKPNE
jgi:hypothetical protein